MRPAEPNSTPESGPIAIAFPPSMGAPPASAPVLLTENAQPEPGSTVREELILWGLMVIAALPLGVSLLSAEGLSWGILKLAEESRTFRYVSGFAGLGLIFFQLGLPL